MANINAAIKDHMSMRKDHSPCKEESAELTVGEFVSPLYATLDNEAPDTYCSVETEPNISYQTVIPAAKDVKTDNATRRIDEKYDKKDISCKRFICIPVTITLVTLVSLACLAVLFAEIAKLKSQSVSPQQTSSSQQIQNESVFMSQLQQINKSLQASKREEMENNAAQSNNIQQLNTSIDMQLTTLHNQTQQLSDSNIMHVTETARHTPQPNTATERLQHHVTATFYIPCSLLCCSASLLPLRLLLGQQLQWLIITCVLYHVMWYTHWRVDESGISEHDK